MSLHTWCRQRPGKTSSCTILCSTLTGAELPQAKNKSCIYARRVTQLCLTLCNPVDCGLPGSLSERGFSRQEYWSILANSGCHTLLEHCISCYPSHQPPEYLVLPEPLRPKQLHHLYTWPSQGQTQVLQGSLRS